MPDYSSCDESESDLDRADQNDLKGPSHRRLDDGELDSLNIYFRQMAETPLLSCEEELYFTKLHSDAINSFRENLYGFGYV